MNGESPTPTASPGTARRVLMVLAWLWVGLPFAYGLAQLVRTVTRLFTG